MNCPRCSTHLEVVDTRMRPDGVSQRRRRRCPAGCGSFSTVEQFTDAVKNSAELMQAQIARLERDLASARAQIAAVSAVFPQLAPIEMVAA